MYINVYYDRKTKLMHVWDDEKGYYAVPYENYFYIKSEDGTYTSIYGEKLKKVYGESDFYKSAGYETYESDVSIETKYLIETYGDEDSVSKGHKEVFIDIEVSMTPEIPNADTAKNKITAISLFSKQDNHYWCLLLDEEKKTENKERGNVTLASFSNEIELLDFYFRKWKEINPNIVSGWNINKFDLKYIINRTKKILPKYDHLKISPIKKIDYNKIDDEYLIAGISRLDYLKIFKDKKFISEEKNSYKLDDITKEYIKEGKIEFEGSLDQLYKNDINKFIEYNVNDVKLVYKLDEKLKFIDLIKEIAHVCKVPYEFVFMASRFIEGAILINLRKKALIAPDKKGMEEERHELSEFDDDFEKGDENDKNEESEKAAGAYVKIPDKGIYDWVYDLDLESMYPSIIRTINISPEKKRAKVLNWNEVFNHIENMDIEDVSGFFADKLPKNQKIIVESKKGINEYDPEEFSKIFKSNKYAISANGIIYDNRQKGIIPEILDEWFAKRKKYKNLMVEYGNKNETDKYEYYRKRQLVLKVMLNSCYGVLLLRSFRFYDKDNGEATTLTGQFIIKSTDKKIRKIYERKYGNGIKDPVLYMDTDSAFIDGSYAVKDQNLNDEEASRKIIEAASLVQNELNEYYGKFAKHYFNADFHHLKIKQEYVARRAFFISKKHYAQWIINKEGVIKNDFDIKGIETIKSDFPKCFSEFSKKLIISILTGKSNTDVNEMITDFKNSIDKRSLDEISKPTSVKNIKKFILDAKKLTYSKGTPAHVKAAINYNCFLKSKGLENSHDFIKNGEKIRWVYLKKNSYGFDNIAYRGYDDPKELIDFINKYVDREKMYKNVLEKKIQKIYLALGWNFPNDYEFISSEYFLIEG